MDIENKEFVLFLKCAQENNLRYLIIGGYAFNYFGFYRYTEDMDVWIAPTNENKTCFLNTLKCMGYTDTELEIIKNEDFTDYFMCSLGAAPDIIDVLIIIHKNINCDAAEKQASRHEIGNGIRVNFIPYDFLKEVKLRSSRHKDLFDIARLEELRNKK